ncbi:hypothetical protein E4L96_04280 [Massilia arenosa]|uniref:Poly(Hydroxyalkanoate) granule-associated protein n=1 Tax=Zemynaea arenosa TaxID=2561931 RepID=A0A4Y9SNE9_9BURK|nr:phasin family protein [Massilia arenosa]TFW26509.1 hypothetical protein E4L96_04280 [Massilia arenosa]
MAGKPKAKQAPGAVQDDEQLAGAIRSVAAQIWQAGLGAFAKAQQDNESFDRLVEEGAELQRRTRSFPERAEDGTGALEEVFEERVARALAAIGVPSRRDIEALHARIDELAARLDGATTPAPRKARAK